MLIMDKPQIQPHDLEAEQAVLGAMSLDSTALARAQELLVPEDFYDSRHRLIFEAMILLAGTNTTIDLVTVGDSLDRTGHLARIGGRGSLAEIFATVASASNIVHHAQIVKDHATRRRVILSSMSLAQRAYEKASVNDLIQEAERNVYNITSGRNGQSWCSAADLATETVHYVDEASKRGTTLLGISTSLHALDDLLGGWQPSDLIIFAARPSMGKTALALQMAHAAALQGHHVGILSVEMARRQLGLRLHGMLASIDIHRLRTGKMNSEEWQRFAAAAQDLALLPMWFDDTSLVNVDGVVAKARTLNATKGLDLLVVDYLGLLDLPHAETRNQGIADASRKLKLLAKELDIPVIVLSQLSRDCERRVDDKRPMLADLRDSGAIEQDADVVLFLYRHEVYVPDTEEKGVAEVLIRKHRNGPIGDRRLRFVDRYARFEDL